MERGYFKSVRLCMADVVGRQYIQKVIAAQAWLTAGGASRLRRIATTPVDFFPATLERRLARLLPQVGRKVCPAWTRPEPGASSREFNLAVNAAVAPLAGLGYYRVGQNGRLYLLAKSEHYHALLGHAFPGYGLIERARLLGIPNATHNNTRGEITRILERELIRLANGLEAHNDGALSKVMRAQRGAVNRVLNLETGSLAAEAALKMMLARFYRVQAGGGKPVHAGKIPVLVVVGDDSGGPGGNYHGTCLVTQWLRGMWPDLVRRVTRAGIAEVVPVRPNNRADLERVFRRCNGGRRRIAGLCYEPVMMNYGACRLEPAFVRRMHSLCRRHGVPTFADEIQTGLWSPEMLMFREYGVRPTFVALGKGFPGGEYPASRVLFSAEMDCLPQFGALVTNGQEELASLAYLISVRWAEANRQATRAVGRQYQGALRDLAAAYPDLLLAVEGVGHMAGLRFRRLPAAKGFAERLNKGGVDISVQAYKADAPPVALTKLPIIVGPEVVRFLVARMDEALRGLRRPGGPAARRCG